MQIEGIIYADTLPYSPYELILSLESKEYPGYNIFITIIKNQRGNFDLIYKKKYYDKVSTITTYLSTYLYEAYEDLILSIFLPEYQDQTKSCIQVDSQPLFLKEKNIREGYCYVV